MLPQKGVKTLRKYLEYLKFCEICKYYPRPYDHICKDCLQDETLTKFKKRENKDDN